MTVRHEVLKRILEAANLEPSACAAALNLSGKVFAEMLSGQRDIPSSHVPLLAAILGVNGSVFEGGKSRANRTDVVPAIWYKLRSDRLTDADREYVLAIRQLAFYQHELERATDSKAVSWKSIFASVRSEVDPQASPTEQGRQAARLFRAATGLDRGALGIGEVFRGTLRSAGILVIETTAQECALEGCTFYVGPSGEERPCLFANSFRTTWFRRNRILMHELAHAIFDVESSAASLDFPNGEDVLTVEEQRADSFAQEALVPAEVLRNVAQRSGIRFDAFDRDALARLVAETHVEQRLLLGALGEAGLVTSDVLSDLAQVPIAEKLKSISEHALQTREFLKLHNIDGGFPRRTTTTTPRKLLLPVRYVNAVLDAFRSSSLSRGKAARMLMIDEYEFEERFGEAQAETAD